MKVQQQITSIITNGLRKAAQYITTAFYSQGGKEMALTFLKLHGYARN